MFHMEVVRVKFPKFLTTVLAAFGIKDASKATAKQLRAAMAVARVSERNARSRYPEWYSRRKARGHRDASLRSRSNRRKAAKRAH